jgi:hypothetical protein
MSMKVQDTEPVQTAAQLLPILSQKKRVSKKD